MNRILLVCLLAAPVAFAQNFSFGVKGGVPLANSLKITDTATYTSSKSPFVLGPAVELHLPLGLGVEADLLYRRLQYTSGANSRTTGQAWEVPLLAKYRAPGALLRPYVAAGYSFRRLALTELSGPFTGNGQRYAQVLERGQGQPLAGLAVSTGAFVDPALVVEGKEGLDLADDFAAGAAGLEDLVKEAKEGAP